VKIQLRNYYRCDADVVKAGGRQYPGRPQTAMGGPESPESLARGMFPKGFPRNPGELAISAHQSGNVITKGDRRRTRADGRAVLRPRSTCEGGKPQGFRKERPRYPLEGRGEQVHVSDERKHSRDAELGKLCPHTSTEYPN